MIGCKPLCFFGEVPPRHERTKKKPYAGGDRAGTACRQTDAEEEPGKLAERTSQVLSVRLFGARVQRGAGRLRRPQKATGLLKYRPSRQARPALCAGQGRQPCPVDVMLCVISYWVLSVAEQAADLQLRCTALPLPRARRSLRDPQKGEMVAETDPTQWPRRKARHL